MIPVGGQSASSRLVERRLVRQVLEPELAVAQLQRVSSRCCALPACSNCAGSAVVAMVARAVARRQRSESSVTRSAGAIRHTSRRWTVWQFALGLFGGILGFRMIRPAAAKGLGELGNSEFSMRLPENFTWNEQLILFPSHLFEKRAAANDPYGKWVLGLSIDEVAASSLSEVGTVSQIADRIDATERDKDGWISSDVISADVASLGSTPTYLIEYKTETSRGSYRYLTRVALIKGKLYTITSQAPEKYWATLERGARDSIESMRLNL